MNNELEELLQIYTKHNEYIKAFFATYDELYKYCLYRFLNKENSKEVSAFLLHLVGLYERLINGNFIEANELDSFKFESETHIELNNLLKYINFEIPNTEKILLMIHLENLLFCKGCN